VNPPLAVIRYLAELDAALAARHAPDRDQIVTQIGEHITEALRDTPEPSDAEITAVLAELGDPLRIAEDAAPATPKHSESPADHATPPMPYEMPPPRPPLLTRTWVPPVAVALWVFGAVGAWTPLLLTDGGPVFAIPWALLVASIVVNVPLVASIVLVCCSPLFRPLGRWVWLLSVPLTLTIDLVGGQGRIDPTFFAPNAALAAVLMAVPPLAAVWSVVMITIRAYRRTAGQSPVRLAPTTQPASQ